MVVTLLHELAHIQDICPTSYFDVEDAESSAQIVALEVLSGLIHSGHDDKKQALFDELKYMTASSLHLVALEFGGLSEFIKFRDGMYYDDPSERAEWHKLNRLYQEDPENVYGVKRILYRYNYLPLQKIFKGLWQGIDGSSYTDITVFPPAAPQEGLYYPPPFSGSTGISKRLSIDDLAYQLRHAEEV